MAVAVLSGKSASTASLPYNELCGKDFPFDSTLQPKWLRFVSARLGPLAALRGLGRGDKSNMYIHYMPPRTPAK
eukprot:9123241-Heterocapsa_arctica.AAC.1